MGDHWDALIDLWTEKEGSTLLYAKGDGRDPFQCPTRKGWYAELFRLLDAARLAKYSAARSVALEDNLIERFLRCLAANALCKRAQSASSGDAYVQRCSANYCSQTLPVSTYPRKAGRCRLTVCAQFNVRFFPFPRFPTKPILHIRYNPKSMIF